MDWVQLLRTKAGGRGRAASLKVTTILRGGVELYKDAFGSVGRFSFSVDNRLPATDFLKLTIDKQFFFFFGLFVTIDLDISVFFCN